MKKIILLSSLLLGGLSVTAQESLTLDKAQELARQNYPLTRQRELIRQTSQLTVDNLSKGYLPQISLGAQATYQSDVTQVKIPVPGINIEPLSKEQYRILADISQLIYDGGLIKQQKAIQQLGEETEQQKLEVELYKLKERINQLFFGVLFLDEQLKQTELVKTDLNIGIKRVQAQVDNGVAFRSNLNLLKAELLKNEQRVIELQSTRKGLIDVLGLFINRSLPENTRLIKPVTVTAIAEDAIRRPELKLFSSQEKLLGSQFNLIEARNKPKASLFLQGGYGRPGLNMLQNEFDFYYTTGIRLNWSLGGLYTRKKEKKIIALSQKTVDIQKDVFLLNTNTQLKQEQSNMDKLQQLVNTDRAIIDLRVSVKEAAKAQLENGVITASDYLREVNAEDQARQMLIVHEVQLLQAKVNYQTVKGE